MNVYSIFLSLALTVGQTMAQIRGIQVGGPITVYGVDIKEGDTLHLGFGTLPNGGFKFIQQPSNGLTGAPRRVLGPDFSNLVLVVKHFKEFENRKVGKKLYAVASPRQGALNVAVDLPLAVDVGEVTGVNSLSFDKKPVGQQPVPSVADELLKLKQLLDTGAITQKEYDTQKGKLLN
ncbi:SHOCT domain-containing protein [Spirosoma arcticum]